MQNTSLECLESIAGAVHMIDRNKPLRLLVIATLGVLAALGCRQEANGAGPKAEAAGPRAETRSARRPSAAPARVGDVRLGRGFVVWESDRSGPWRIWTRRLDGSGLRRLSPNEPQRNHCCAHVSPDGRWVTYLSFQGGGREYPSQSLIGELHLIHPDGSGDRVLATAARTYFENRAAVWRSPNELIYIDGDGYTVLRDLRSDRTRRLTRSARDRHGWLINPTLRFAVDGSAAFSPFDAGRGAVAARSPLGGCEPYFSSDGRWGIWAAGAGGPINRIDLTTGKISTLLRKNDSRLPDGYGYLYFPMVSPDQRLLAWGASKGGHDHFTVDYEIFVAPIDPATLELVGPPVQLTENKKTDRYPDAYLEPLPLGRHQGEAPLTIQLTAPGGGEWSWNFGDGGTQRGRSVSHTWTRPGSYSVVAEAVDRRAAGQVVVAPAQPPEAVGVDVRDEGRELLVRFSEPVREEDPHVRLSSGTEIRGRELLDSGRTLRLRLASPVTGTDKLSVEGFVDEAQRPNRLIPASLNIEPPRWPTDHEGLVLLWQTGNAPNLVPVPGESLDRACTLEPKGRARLDHAWRAVLGAGAFRADPETSSRVRAGLQHTNSFTAEMVLDLTQSGNGPLVSAAAKHPNLRLQLNDSRLEVILLTGSVRRRPYERAELMSIPASGPVHVAVTYSPGQLKGYLRGRLVQESDAIQGDFFHWRDQPIVVGGEQGSVSGSVEGLAVYDRVLSAEEIAEDAARYQDLLSHRSPVSQTVVEATLRARSPIPTLQQITPYRQGLVVYEYDVDRVIRGDAPARIRVAHWAVLDGETQEVAARQPGTRVRLSLEPFDANPQLASLYISNAWGGARPASPIYYSISD